MDRHLHERGPSTAEGSNANERDEAAVRSARRVAGAYALLAALAALAACGGGGGDGPAAVTGGGGGPVGSVVAGAGIQFVSRHNGTMNPAVDTIAVGGTMTWTFTGSLAHSVRSVGAPSFASSDLRTGSGTYTVTFSTAGVYHYDCAAHGAAMTGTVVVLAGGADAATQTVADPTGDTFGATGVQWDLTGLTVARDTGGVTAQLAFTNDVLSPMSGAVQSIIGYLEFDLDQNEVSGGGSVVDVFRTDGGTTGLGVDATVDLSVFAADSTVAVYDSLAHVTGRVKPVFDGTTITVRVPRALLGNDDGFLDAAAIVGNTRAPTDFVPQSGHLTLNAPNSAASATSSRAAAAVRRGARRATATRAVAWVSM